MLSAIELVVIGQAHPDEGVHAGSDRGIDLLLALRKFLERQHKEDRYRICSAYFCQLQSRID